jgi:hypothetical protein
VAVLGLKWVVLEEMVGLMARVDRLLVLLLHQVSAATT